MSYTKQNFTDDRVLMAEDLERIEDGILERILTPTAAAVGQTIVVSEVDEDGKPIAWEMSSGWGKWRQIVDATLTEEVGLFVVDKDMNGEEFRLKEFYVLVCSQVPEGTAFTTIKVTVNGKPFGQSERGYPISANITSNDTNKVRHYFFYGKFIPNVGGMAWHGVSPNLFNHKAQMEQMLQPYNNVYLDNGFYRIVVEPNDGNAMVGGVGTTIKIWGLDA